MLGAGLTFLFCLGAAGLGGAVFGRLLRDLDKAAAWGLSGMLGLGLVGWATLPIGLLPGGLRWGFWVVAAAGVAGIALAVLRLRAGELRIAKPEGLHWAFAGALALAFLFALVGVLGPSDAQDWDSLAYHLAVPKLWLAEGRITWIPYIHHSNFPFAIDNLYVWGLSWGGQSGAKAFSLAYSAFGAAALFGLARARYGASAGWWAALAFLAMPAALWESGTAYIDAAHGLWAGLGILFAAGAISEPDRRNRLWLAAICLGFAAASKYTGLQAVAAAGLGIALIGAASRRFGSGLKAAVVAGSAALAICAPWLIKNAVWTGNPVYPFFYETFGGKSWSEFHARIYRNEQQTFGVVRTDSRLDWLQFPHAVLGLAYQPGRYVNPGQSEGLGMPTGALGAAVLAAGLLWLVSGRARLFEGSALLIVGLCFVLWFGLSQQSRYAMNMGVPLCVLLGGGVVRLRAGPMLAGLAALQAVYALWLVHGATVRPKLPVALGQVSEDDYLSRAVPFYEASKAINETAAGGKVALYDEVFGWFLDAPYVWANPGHSTLIPYDRLDTGGQFAAELRRQGFTHVYVSWAVDRGSPFRRWDPREGRFGFDDREAAYADPEQKWKVLLAEALESGDARPLAVFRSGLLASL